MRAFDAFCVEREADGVLTDAEVRSTEFGLECKDPSLANQSSAEEADINTIVRRFGLDKSPVPPGGFVLPGAVDPATEVVEVFDFRGALHAVQDAQRSFGALSARVRARFDNDPAAFVDFCTNPANLDEMRELGLALPKKKEELPPPTPPA